MVTIITRYASKELFYHYWYPMIHKHNEAEFIIIGTEGQFQPEAKNLRFIDTFEEAYQNAKGEFLLVTDFDSIPTYKLMTLIPMMGQRNEILIPKWQGYMKPPESPPNTFGLPKKNYAGESADDYIGKYNPKIRNISSVYYVEEGR